MSLSQVQIVNIALSKIGDYYISAMTEGTKQSVFANIHWESARDSLLESYPWNFATERAQLARLGATPTAVYDYYYQLPNDCLRVLEFSGSDEFDSSLSFDYKVEGRKVATNEAAVYIKYIKQETDTTIYPPSFSKLLACDLALILSEPLGNASEAAKQLIMTEREAIFNDARGNDFNEGSNEPVGYYATIGCRE